MRKRTPKNHGSKFSEVNHYRICPLFTWARIALVITTDVGKSIESRKHDMGKTKACTILSGDRVTVILPKISRPGMIAHEATHAAMFILNETGVKLDGETDEPLAYLVDYLVEWFTQKICEGLAIHRK